MKISMAETFDPYHKWLGIPPKDQPPNHYRLLGVELFESDIDVISHAADMRMTLLRSFQSGKRSAQALRIRNEISAARICLVDSKKKAAYDTNIMAQQIEGGMKASTESGNVTNVTDFATRVVQSGVLTAEEMGTFRKKLGDSDTIIHLASAW